MIMTRNDDGTYSQVGFIKDVSGADIEYIKDKNGVILFEKGFSREKSGALPLQIEGIGKPLKDYTIYGNTYQAEGVSPDNPQEVQAVGERTGNLFNGEIQQGSLADSNGALVTSSTRVRTTKINVNENTIYTISSNLIVRNVIAYKNEAFVEQAFDGAAIFSTISSFTVPAGANQIAISFKGNPAGNIGITPNDLECLMLNEGKTALPHEPYGYKIPFTTAAEDGSESITTTAYLDNPIHKIGDYADVLSYSGKSVERVIKELVLTGEENITHHKTFSGYVSVRIPIIGYALHNSQLFCTHSQQISFPNLFNGTKIGIAVHNTQDLDYVILAVDGLNSKDDYKNWLAEQYAAGTPVKVWYVLVDPVTETVELPEIPTLDGTTVIDVDTAVQPSEMQIKYKSKI